MNDAIFGKPEEYEATNAPPTPPPSPFGTLPKQGALIFGEPESYDETAANAPPSAAQSAGAIATGALQPAARALRSLTPRRMGEYLEQRTLPQFEESTQRAAIRREQERARNEAEVAGISPTAQKATAFLGSAANLPSMSVAPWISAAMGKGAAKAGIPGFQQFEEPSISEIKKQIDIKQRALEELHPGYSLAGSGVGLAAGAKALPVVAPARGPMVSGALTGAAYGSIAGGATEGSLIDAIKGAGIGLIGGAVAAPIMERAASGLTRLFVGGKPVVDSSGALTLEARKVASQAGLTDDEINKLAPQLREVFEQRGLTPAAARESRFREFGIEPKRGMVDQKPQQLAAEKQFGDYTPQAAQTTAAAEQFVGGPQAPLRDSIEAAVNKAGSNAAGLKATVDAAYAKAGQTPGSFSRETLENVGDKLLQSWTPNPKLLAFRNNEVAQAAAKKLNSDLGTFLEAGSGVRIMHRNFRAVEEARKGLNEAFSAAKTPTDRAAVRKLIESYDDYVESAIASGAFKGDPNVLQEWKNARKLFSDYQNKFGVKKTGEEAGSLLKAIVEGNKTPEDVAKMMFSFAGSGDAAMKQNALKTYFQLRRALGPNSPELENIKRSYIQEIMTPPEASQKGFAAAGKKIDMFLKGNASDFSRRVLSSQEREALGRYAEVMRQAGTTSPETTRRQINQITNAIATGVPVVASGASYVLSIAHPVLAGLVGGASAGIGATRAYKGSEFVARRIANKGPRDVPREREFPSVRTGIPAAATATPSIERTAPGAFEQFDRTQAVAPEDQRKARAAGGKVAIDHHAEAENLIRRFEPARKNHGKQTKSLLGQDDNAIAKALKVANENI